MGLERWDLMGVEFFRLFMDEGEVHMVGWVKIKIFS